MVQVDAEASNAGDAVGRVGNVLLAVLFQGARDQRGQDGLFDFGSGERGVVDGADFAFEADRGGGAGNQEQVAAALFDQGREPALEPIGVGFGRVVRADPL